MRWAPVMAEEYWMNTPLAPVRYFGQAKLDDYAYVIVNKEGKDIFECSREAEVAGRDKAIEPGEPCDLCRMDYVPAYQALGRERMLELLKQNKSLDEINAQAGLKSQATRKKRR